MATVELNGVPPGKLQAYPVVLADALLVNCTVVDTQPLVGVPVKFAVGGVAMVTTWVAVLVPQALVAVSTTVYTPSLMYVWVGLVAVLELPSPKFQL